MPCFSVRRHDRGYHITIAALYCCVAATSFIPLSASAQFCRGNANIGCTNSGAKCSDGNVLNGRCKTNAAPRGERECLCVGTPPPPVTFNPKFLVGGLVYAPPGCTSSSPGSACSQPGAVDYSGANSLGTKVTTADSFKNGVKVTANFGSEQGGFGGSFEWSRTTSDTQSANLTKSDSLEIKVFGNQDGLNHDQDMFILLLNPTVTLSSNGTTNINWQPGYSGGAAARYEVYVSELRNPAAMRPVVAAVLKAHGFTNADFKTIRCLDQFAGPGISGPGGGMADYCEPVVVIGPPPGLDPNRFQLTTWILPYEPPLHASDLCPTVTVSLKNEYATEYAASTQDEYSVTADMTVGVKDVWGVKIEGQMTWTSAQTDSNSKDSTQSASLTLVCPSVAYTGPTLFQVYYDVLYGTFLLIPYDPSSMEIIQHGTVTDTTGKPIKAEPINFEFGGRTYHTFTTAQGTYRFIALKHLLTQNLRTGNVVVRDKKLEVGVGPQSSSEIRLQ